MLEGNQILISSIEDDFCKHLDSDKQRLIKQTQLKMKTAANEVKLIKAA